MVAALVNRFRRLLVFRRGGDRGFEGFGPGPRDRDLIEGAFRQVGEDFDRDFELVLRCLGANSV